MLAVNPAGRKEPGIRTVCWAGNHRMSDKQTRKQAVEQAVKKADSKL